MATIVSKKVSSQQSPKEIRFWLLFALFWCGLSFTLFWVFAIQARDIIGGIVSSVFSLIGLSILFFTVKATLEYRKFGQVELTLDSEPMLGRAFGATIRLPAGPALTKLAVELACVQLISKRDADGDYSTHHVDTWSSNQEFPVRRGTTGSYATLRFDVPGDRPASTHSEDAGRDHSQLEARMKDAFKDAFTDLAKMRALRADLARMQARGQYRWELRVRADVPGIDLDRTFNLDVMPLPAGAKQQSPASRPAPAPRVDPAVEARAAARPAASRMLSGIGSALAGLVLVGIFMYQFGVLHRLHDNDFRGATNWVRGKLGLAVPGAPVAGFDAQAEEPRRIAVAARGIAAESDGTVLTVRVQEMRLEKLPLGTERYEQTGAVVYRSGDWPERSFGYAWQDVRGELTRDAPVVSLANRVFQFGGIGPRCADGGCEVRFFAVLDAGSGATAPDRTEGFRLRRITAVAQAARPALAVRRGARAWAPLFGGAMEAFSGGRDADAERLLRDTLALIEKHHGAGHPAAARVHYQSSLLYERQKQPAEQEKELIAARDILFNLPDKVVKEDLAPDASIDLEMITRRLADFYREQRRYGEAIVLYRRAQQYVSRIEVAEPERNRRLARNAAGRMATACAQQAWGEADEAMTELKARIVDVDVETRKQLEDSVRTGEPRLAARKC